MLQCFECSSTSSLHNHHVVPKVYGGTKTVTLCEKCHGLVHNREMNTRALTLKALSTRRLNNVIISGRIPYGYKRSTKDPSKLVEVSYQQKIIKEIVERKNKGEPICVIASILTKRGVKTAYGGKWRSNTITAIYIRHQKLNNDIKTYI